MITIIGTGHVFRLSEPIMFIIKNIWPEAVLVELDEKRYNTLTNPPTDEEIEKNQNISGLYRSTVLYQRKTAEKYGTNVGGELLTAINTGRLIGADIICIDRDIGMTMKRISEEMPFFEKLRYSISNRTTKFKLRKKDYDPLMDIINNGESMKKEMQKKFPTFYRVLITERDEFMANNIKNCAEKYNKMIVVCGDMHIDGLSVLLKDYELDIVRLKDIINKESLDGIRSKAWNHEGENDS